MRKKASLIFPIGLIILLLVSSFGIWCISSLRQAVHYEHLSMKIHDNADQIHDFILAAESNQRGYLLTHDPSYLDNYYSSLTDIPSSFDKLILLMADSGVRDQAESITEIRSLIDEKIQKMNNLIRQVKNDNESSRKPKKVLSSDIEKNLINKIKSELNNIKNLAMVQASNHSRFIRNYTNSLIIVSCLGLLLSITLLILNLLINRKQIKERELEKDEILQARREALESSALKSKFLATVSHEIRTPLNGIIGLSDVLRKSSIASSEIKLAEVIHSSGQILLKIINDILDFSRIESGKIQFEFSEFKLNEMSEQIINSLSIKSAEKSINLKIQIDEDIPFIVYGDSSRISQVLYNLVGNAVKFTSMGSVILKIKKDLSSTQDQLKINFSIEDTGTGIAYDQIKNLFQPFHQVHKVGTSGEAGTGLGLSISQHLISAMGGDKIQVISDLDRGSKFYFSLYFKNFSKETISDYKKSVSQVIHDAPRAIIKPLFNDSERPLFLVVEDNITNQITIQTILNKLGIDVILASNGKECLDVVKDNPIDLIFMDCQMPVMDGLDATRALKKSRVCIPIIAMTANASHDEEVACYSAGMSGFITKPVTIDSIISEILKYIKPDSSVIVEKTLHDLEAIIGVDGKNKVIQAYLSVLPDFRSNLNKYISDKNITELNKLGHRYKSSSLTVGANGIATLCKKLEKEIQIEKIKDLSDKIQSASKIIEKEFFNMIC